MNSIPVAFDELQIIKDKFESYDSLIMQLTEGIDRSRGKSYGGVETQGTWQNVFFFSGEEPIIKENSGGGVKNRVMEIEANEKLALLVSVNTTNERLHIIPKDLKIRSTVRELDVLAEVLGIEVTTEPQDSNYIRISYADYDDDKNFAILYFVNKKGEQIDFQINVKKIVEN